MAAQRSRFVKKIFEWTVGVCSVVAILVVLSPLFMEDKRPRRTTELARLKQLGTALNIYLSDNNDRFPPDMSCARGAFRSSPKLVGDGTILDSRNGVSHEWLGNGSLALQDADRVKNPYRTVMLFDSAPRKDHDHARRVLVNTDTSARVLPESGFQATIVNDWVIPENKP